MEGIFIIGCGDIGARVAARWRARGMRVRGMARNGAAARRLDRSGIIPVAADLDHPASLRGLPVSRQGLYYFAPPPERGETDPRVEALLSAIEHHAPPAAVVYISTSGVYGDRGGDVVDEESDPAPITTRAKRRLDAENRFRNWGREHGVRVVVLRVGGIYGPGRLPVERLIQGIPVLSPEEARPSNRIHAEDLAGICVAALERGRTDAVYNVADGNHATLTEYFFTVADMLGLPRPPTIPLEEARSRLSEAMLSYLCESRRLDCRRMFEELQVDLRYPDLRSGLTQIVAEESLLGKPSCHSP